MDTTTFYDHKKQYRWEEVSALIAEKTAADVERALSKPRCDLDDFAALISPAAERFLDNLATKAQMLTQQRFGKTIQMYVPLYLSNYCTNHCVYCGFNCHNKIARKRLTPEEILQEVQVLKEWGMKHLLLVSGEAPRLVGVDYYEKAIGLLHDHFAQISLEVQPLECKEYCKLVEAGLHGVYVYQETYNEETYPLFHPKGPKANYRYRLETPERCGAAGVHKIGIGALLGLQEWRTDSFFTAVHLTYLERKYWRSRYSISLPRLRPHAGSFMPKDPISDTGMVQLICAFRLLDPEVDISLSTRESAAFRDMAMRIGVTAMSAASSTQPGGYAEPQEELQQFSIDDARSVEEFAQAVRAQGYEPIWKDWDSWM